MPGLRPIVKIAGVFVSDNQAVHELIGKIVDANMPNRTAVFRRPGMERIAGQIPGERSSEFRNLVSQSLLLAVVFIFPRRRPMTCPGANIFPSVQIGLPVSFSFQPQTPQRRSVTMRRFNRRSVEHPQLTVIFKTQL